MKPTAEMKFGQKNWPNPLALDVNRHYDWGMANRRHGKGMDPYNQRARAYKAARSHYTPAIGDTLKLVDLNARFIFGQEPGALAIVESIRDNFWITVRFVDGSDGFTSTQNILATDACWLSFDKLN